MRKHNKHVGARTNATSPTPMRTSNNLVHCPTKTDASISWTVYLTLYTWVVCGCTTRTTGRSSSPPSDQRDVWLFASVVWRDPTDTVFGFLYAYKKKKNMYDP